MDWRAHPLGDPRTWPPRLTAMLDMVLAAPTPMWLGWGPELFFFGNDACVAWTGQPWARVNGRPAAEVWGATWAEFRPQVERVLARGESSRCRVTLSTVSRQGAEKIQVECACSPLPWRATGVWCILAGVVDSALLTTTPPNSAPTSAGSAPSARGSESARGDAQDPYLAFAAEVAKLGLFDWDVRAERLHWIVRPPGLGTVGAPATWRSADDFLECVVVEDRARVTGLFRAGALRDRFEVEFRAAGTGAWHRASCQVVHDARGPARLLGVVADVSETRRAMDAVSEGEGRFSRFMQHLPGVAWLKDDTGRYVFTNRSAGEFLGRGPAELLGRSDADLFPEPVAGRLRQADAAARAQHGGTQTIEAPISDEQGTERHFLVSRFPVPVASGPTPWVGAIAVDVTPHVKSERAVEAARDELETRVRVRTSELEEANARFRAVFEQGVFAAILALDGTLTDVSQTWLDATGFSRSDVVGRKLWEAGWWGDSPDVEAWLKIGFAEATRGARFLGETVGRSHAGAEQRLELALVPIRQPSGELSFVLATGMDTSERHRWTQERQRMDVARESEARFRRMANFAPVLIWTSDQNNGGTWFNQQWLEFVGRPLERELGKGWLENVHAEDAERCLKTWQGALERRAPFAMEFRLRRHDGEFRWVLDHGLPMVRHDGEFAGFIGTCIDITERKQAERAVQRLAAIVESSGDAILAVDLDGFVTNWNRGAEVLYGYSAIEIIGQPVSILVPPERRTEDASLIRRIIEGESLEHVETQRCRKDGTIVDVSVSMSPIRGESGEVVGVSRIARDISGRKRAEEAQRQSEERFRTLADNIAQIAWTADERGRITWMNRRWFEYTGLDASGGDALDVNSRHHPEHRRRVVEKFARCIAEGRVWEDTFPLRGKDGEYRWFLSRAVPIGTGEGRVARWFGTNTDVTELRQIERELERARDEAVAASRAKDDFLAALSHELRTPLNPVLLLASDAAEDPSLPEDVRADFEDIRKHVSLEARLIDDLLDLTRISRGVLSLDWGEHDVNVLVRDAIATVAGDMAEKSIELGVAVDGPGSRVRADAVRLQQAVWNILRNAIKFTPARGRIEVSTRLSAARDSVEIAVSDTGIGITAEELARIFEAFSQGDHARGDAVHRFGGLGLGLTISRRVVEMHGGRIEASSAGVGQGARFVIVLPVLSGAPVPNERAAPVSPGLTATTFAGARVLLVEDHVPTRMALKRLLVRRGFSVIPAGSAGEARSVIQEMGFDLLISDIGLPDGNGCELMRESAAARGVPGVALTGYGMEQDVERSRQAGFAAHLTKPISVQALDRAIALALSGHASAPPNS